VAHITKEKEKLLARVGRIRGQVEAIEKALEEERECSAVFEQIASCRGAINGLMAEIMQGEIRFQCSAPKQNPTPKKLVLLNSLFRSFALTLSEPNSAPPSPPKLTLVASCCRWH
jgi:DNA-binding FrmR family transcriptional regulator